MARASIADASEHMTTSLQRTMEVKDGDVSCSSSNLHKQNLVMVEHISFMFTQPVHPHEMIKVDVFLFKWVREKPPTREWFWFD